MKIIQHGDKGINKILGYKKVESYEIYHTSNYLYSCINENHQYVKQNLTGKVVQLTEHEKKVLLIAAEEQILGTEILDYNAEKLVEQYFLVPVMSNELQWYKMVRLVMKTLGHSGKGVKKYTILPTTGCNAKCVYCYEEGMVVRKMTPQVAEDVVEFIGRTRCDDEVKLVWFGGEPLTAKTIISQIYRELTEKGVPFTSQIITNAILMTPELAKEAKEIWHLKKAQVSVDGARSDYEARKQYVNPKLHNYDAMLRAVHALLDEGIEVTLRVNYDGKNMDGMKEFLDEIRREFDNSEKLFLYFGMLFQEQKKETCVELYRKMYDLRRYLDETGMHYRKPPKERFQFKVNYCMADSLGDSVVIDPEGKLFHCEHLPGNDSFGSIYDEEFQFVPESGTEEPDEQCRNCPFLPECTPFRKNRCPDWFPYCREFKEIDAEYFFEKLAARTETDE